jgi:ectoine hydroxylase
MTTLKVLTESQCHQYETDGYLVLDSFVANDWLDRLNAVTDQFIERSRGIAASNSQFDVEPDHSADNPRIRRLISPIDQHPVYWEFASQSAIVDIVEDLIGPDIKFHHGKLNFKSPRGGAEVKWHQDIQFWPHTNYDLLSIGVYLHDVVKGQGEMGFIPGSHNGELFDLYNDDHWTGHLQDDDLQHVALNSAVFPTGKAGTVTVHSCRMIHGSYPNQSDNSRPLLLQTYTAADAIAYTDLVRKTPHGEQLIRGKAAKWARHDPRPCLLPPSVIGTIFQAQQSKM